MLLVFLLLLQLRPVQTFLAHQVLSLVSNQTDHEISIDRVEIAWLDQVQLHEILVRDYKEDTLVYTEKLMVNYTLTDLINGAYMSIEEVSSENLRLKLTKYDSLSKLNISVFLDALKTDTTKKESKPLNVDFLGLADLRLTLQDKSSKRQPDKLDFGNLDFTIPQFSIGEFGMANDTILANILQFQGYEKHSTFEITELQTKLRLCNFSLSVDDLVFETPTSHVADSLEFFFNGLDDFGSFADSVSFILHFNESRISSKDLAILTGVNQVKEDITIDGILWGTVGDFNIEQTRVGYGESYFVGGVSCFGLPDISQTFLLADLTDSHLFPDDLRPYIGDYTDNLEQMGTIDFTGSFAGYAHDFIARGDFMTDHGSVHTDINLKIPDDVSQMSYVGHLEFKEVNVGAFLKNELLQQINLKAKIDGKGVKPENAEFDLEAVMYESGLKGYIYDSIAANGKFAQNFFDGSFYIKDPNCSLNGTAQVDLTQELEVLNLDMEVGRLDARAINLTDKNITSYGKISVEAIDLDIDNLTGRVELDSGQIRIDDKRVVLDSIRFKAMFEDSTRVVAFGFPGFSSSMKGKFKITSVLRDLPLMVNRYRKKLNLGTDEDVVSGDSEDRYTLNLNAEIKDLSPYFDSLRIPISLAPAIIETSFRKNASENINVYFQTDRLSLGGSVLHDPELEINASNELDASAILTNFIFTSSSQELPGVPGTENLLLEGVWYDNDIDLTTLVSQPLTHSKLRMESNVHLGKDSITLKMLPSEIMLLDDDWNFRESNRIVFKEGNIKISNLEIHDATESIAISGNFADSLTSEITVTTEDLEMDKIGLLSEAAIGGFLNGNFHLFRDHSESPFKFDGDFLLKHLTYDQIDVGDIKGSSEWNPNSKSVYTKIEVERENFSAVQVEGFYYPFETNESLDIDVRFEEADLKMGAPFLEDNFSDISGHANGILKITGSPSDPVVIGSCEVKDGNVTINYLNTHYTYSGEVELDPQTIKLQRFNLTDRKGAKASVTGKIHHTSFRDLVTDIRMKADNFEFLNTTSLDNKLYYGSAYGTGHIDVKGPLTDLKISADIVTNGGTKFFVPVSQGSNVGQEDYIHFLDLRDTTSVDADNNFNIKGLTIEFNIEVTPEAYCELIFDIKSGDIIRGRGSGDLKLSLDTDGEFNMFGPLEITEGAYNFTVPGLFSKEFEVVPGSRITWYGDPYNAILDLDATYLQPASFEALKNPVDQDKTELAKKTPILVILEIDGGMLSPQIDFDLRLKNESDATQENIPLLSQITSDEQELKRQVISLLFLKRFSPRQSFTLSGGGSFGGSVSELLSSQVSYLVSQIDENLEVEVNLADFNSEAFNTFQLRFAYTFLDGRLKVSRGGDFGSETDNNDNVLNDIVGDWFVEYNLTKDGRLRAKVFRNTDQRIQVSDTQQNHETGISLRFVHSFSDLKELLTLSRNEGLLLKEEETEEQEQTQSEDTIRDSTR